MKLGVMKQALPGSLEAADRVFCYSGGLTWDAGGGARAPRATRRAFMPISTQLVRAIAAESRAGDHVLVMSNGGFGGIHDKLLEALGSAAGPDT